MVIASVRSANPMACARRMSTHNPLRFSMSTSGWSFAPTAPIVEEAGREGVGSGQPHSSG
jgi:hypothetical protein